MQHTRALNRQFLLELQNSISANVLLYKEEKCWIEKWAAGKPWDFATPCEIATPLELLIPKGGNLFDTENSIRLHKALPNLTPVQAQDPRLWARLTHVELWAYMRVRWPVERYLAKSDGAIAPIRERYFVAQRQSRSLVRNGAARLWWAAKMTCDQDRDNPYELTHVLLSSLDIAKNLLERNFGRSIIVTRTVLDFLLRNKDVCLQDGNRSRQIVRDLTKALNLHGGVCLLDCMAPTDLVGFLESEKEKSLEKIASSGSAVGAVGNLADEDEE